MTETCATRLRSRRESFAELRPSSGGEGWTVRQGGPVALWELARRAG